MKKINLYIIYTYNIFSRQKVKIVEIVEKLRKNVKEVVYIGRKIKYNNIVKGNLKIPKKSISRKDGN